MQSTCLVRLIHCRGSLKTYNHAFNQRVVEAMLNKLGIEYELANDGIEACCLAQDEKFSVILMDCQMPNMDGYAATKEIKREG